MEKYNRKDYGFKKVVMFFLKVIIRILFFASTYLCFLEKAYLSTMISSKKVVIEPTAGVNEAKICPKIAQNCPKLQIFLFPNAIELSKYYSVFQHIFVFLRKSISGYHDIKQKSGHKTNS